MGTMKRAVAAGISVLVIGSGAWGQATGPAGGVGMGTGHSVYVEHWRQQGDGWYSSAEGKAVVANIISWQRADGGWHKSYDTGVMKPSVVPLHEDGPLVPASDRSNVWESVSTIDNDATYTELEILAKARQLTGNAEAERAYLKGMDYLLGAQYPNGGFPQRFPLQDNYGRHITFNDGAMVGVMQLLKNTAEGVHGFEFTAAGLRGRCKAALDRAVDCTLKCQIVKEGALTVWCQQHDEVTLAPAGGRMYEVPSYCSSESAGVAEFLMELPPDDRIRKSVDGAAAWFKAHEIAGKEFRRVRGEQYEGGSDRVLVDVPDAAPLWARFYDIATDKPIFPDRQAVVHLNVAELPKERRTGYSWYGNWGNSFLKKYAKWKG